MADSRRDQYGLLFEAITGCVFFSTPFGGALVASVAAMYASVASSKLSDLMKPDEEELRQPKNEFLRLSTKISPKTELCCFWEEQETEFSTMSPLLKAFCSPKLPKKYAEFVSRDSATLPGAEEMGLACNHRDLVKYDSTKYPK